MNVFERQKRAARDRRGAVPVFIRATLRDRKLSYYLTKQYASAVRAPAQLLHTSLLSSVSIQEATRMRFWNVAMATDVNAAVTAKPFVSKCYSALV